MTSFPNESRTIRGATTICFYVSETSRRGSRNVRIDRKLGLIVIGDPDPPNREVDGGSLDPLHVIRGIRGQSRCQARKWERNRDSKSGMRRRNRRLSTSGGVRAAMSAR